MAELKTKPSDVSVAAFLDALPNEQQRADCYAILAMMRDATGAEPQIWGGTIVGFGKQRYQYASGRSGEWFVVGFSPRKQNTTLYLNYGFDDDEALLARLGKFSTGKACLYVKRLSDVDQDVLRELIQRTVARKTAS